MGKEDYYYDKYVNTDFRIVINYNRKKGEERKRHLVGRRGLQNAIGTELYIKAISRAYRGKSEKITIKLRRGLQIIFYKK